MPGKLDHASVVAYRVGKWPPITNTTPPLLRRMTECNGGGMELDGVFIGMDRYNDNDEREEGETQNEYLYKGNKIICAKGVMEEANQEKRREVHQTQSDFFVMSQLPQHQPQQEQINCNMMKVNIIVSKLKAEPQPEFTLFSQLCPPPLPLAQP